MDAPCVKDYQVQTGILVEDAVSFVTEKQQMDLYSEQLSKRVEREKYHLAPTGLVLGVLEDCKDYDF